MVTERRYKAANTHLVLLVICPDRHGCVDRSHKRKKCDFLLNQTRTAGRKHWFLRVMLAAICQHLDAWYALAQRTQTGQSTQPT